MMQRFDRQFDEFDKYFLKMLRKQIKRHILIICFHRVDSFKDASFNIGINININSINHICK